MTIHKAKGLEFPVFFVTGLIDDMLLHKNGDKDCLRLDFQSDEAALSDLCQHLCWEAGVY